MGLMLQKLTPQLLAVPRLHGFGHGLAQVLADKLSGKLGSRVQELLWYPGVETPAEVVLITIGSLRLDLARRLFWPNHEPIHLSPKEFDLLALMMKRPDVPFTHVKLCQSGAFEYAGERQYLRTYALTTKPLASGCRRRAGVAARSATISLLTIRRSAVDVGCGPFLWGGRRNYVRTRRTSCRWEMVFECTVTGLGHGFGSGFLPTPFLCFCPGTHQ